MHCLGLAVDEVKYALKVKDGEGKATKLETKNYEVLKYSTSKLFLVRIMGAVAEELMGAKVADLFTWQLSVPRLSSRTSQKLVFPWKEVVEAVLPIVASTVGNAYDATRDFAGLPALELRVAAAINIASVITWLSDSPR